MPQRLQSAVAAAALVVAANAFPPSTGAQQACTPPPLPTLTQPNVFSEEQENDLGDFVTEKISRNFHIVDDEVVTGRLRDIGARLLSYMPATKIHFQFFVIDLAEANAFSLPGGGIYVSRKLIAQTQSEDELAGLLGHELGHVFARQGSANATRQLKAVLNVTRVGDRRDIYDTMNRLYDNIGRKPGVMSAADENADQIAADRLGFYALVAAGYNPGALATLFDRTADTRGRTGNFFSDLFGATSADSKRLRDLLKQSSSLPSACGETRHAESGDAYASWRTAVVSYTGVGRNESIHGLISKTTLDHPLAAEITNLRFSPDGKFVLAQDDDGINVLTRTPLQPLFRIDAPDADDAFFTPDSARIAYATSGLRVESWRVSDRKLDAAYEVAPHPACVQTLLSPDAGTLACLDTDRALTLYDVATNAVLFQKPRFYLPSEVVAIVNVNYTLSSSPGPPIAMQFSTDGRYLVAFQHRAVLIGGQYGIANDDYVLAYDLKSKQTLNLKNDVKELITRGSVFTGPDRLTALGVNRQQTSAFITLPAGTIQKITLDADPGTGAMSPATSGDVVFLRPFRQYAVGIVDLKQGKILQGSTLSAIDVIDRTFVSERGNGDIGLYSLDTTQLTAEAAMARTSLGRLRTVEVSPDFSLLAISERTRGAIWNLTSHTVVGEIRAFRGGYFDAAGVFYTDLPRSGTTPRQLTRIDTATKNGGAVAPIADAVADQYGRFLVAKHRPLPPEKPVGVVYDVRDVTTGQSIWTRTFTELDPEFWVSSNANAIVFGWPVDSQHARDETRTSPALAKALGAIGNGTGAVLDIVDARTGAPRTSIVVDTNRSSFGIRHAYVADNWLWLEDTANRVHVYALDTGVEKGQVFGDWASIASNGGALSVENGTTTVAVYDLATLNKRDQFTFAHGVLRSALSPDGRRLFVLTADQTVYLIDVSGGK